MDTLDNINEENEPRPRFLTVLCILTFISTGLSLVFGLFNLIKGRQSEEAMLDAKVALAQSTSQMREIGWTSFVDMMEKFERMSVEINANFYLAGTIGLITAGLGLYGALKMWKGFKIGFHSYIIYNLLAIGGIYLYVSPGNVPTIVVIINLILSGVFILMYSRNLKWMK